MRVPNLSLYSNSKYNLMGLTSDLQDSNEVMSTRKRINSLSDDPIGMSQTLNLKTTIENLTQIEKNVNMGISWLKGGENAMDSVSDRILEVKTEVTRLINDSMSIDERQDAIAYVQDIMEEIVTLGNTQINGNYIFSGTDTDVKPLEYDRSTQQVTYKGNNTAFSIKTDKEITVPVGRDGRETFWATRVNINETNNTIIFQEDNGHGPASEKTMSVTLESGDYTREALGQAIEKALNAASAKDGYGVSYEVGYEDSGTFSIREDGSYDGYFKTQFLWETGSDPYITNISAGATIDPDDINIEINTSDALNLSTKSGEPFRLTWQGDNTWVLDNNPGYTIIPSGTITGKNDKIEIDLDESGTPDITITLDSPVSTVGQYIEFDIVAAGEDQGIADEIGFKDGNAVYEPATSDNSASFITELIFTAANNSIDFEEVDSAGVVSAHSITIPAGTYTDIDTLTAAIESAMETASTNAVDYSVSYDPKTSQFNFRENGTTLDGLNMLWSSSTAASSLGFYTTSNDSITYPTSDNAAQLFITIDDSNDGIAFEEKNGAAQSGVLWAQVPHGQYKTEAALEQAVKQALETASLYGETYTVDYDGVTDKFSIESDGSVTTDLSLYWSDAEEAGNSIGSTLGYDADDDIGAGLGPYTGDNDMVLMSFDASNNVFDLEEIYPDGTVSDSIPITIPEGDYTDLNAVAAAVQSGLRNSTSTGVDYVVEYDDVSDQFLIKGSDDQIKGFSLLWQTGENWSNHTGTMLGFMGDDHVTYSESDASVVNITIDGTNNAINFTETLSGASGISDELTARIKAKTYTSHEQLALEVEKALEEASLPERQPDRLFGDLG